LPSTTSSCRRCVQRRHLRPLVPPESKGNPELLRLSKDELMRHEAAGITTDNFPKLVKLGGVDCAPAICTAPAMRATA
jgi:hypothetical protein